MWIWNATEAIIIHDNLFTGELPSSINITRLSSLTMLELWGNSLNGTLPSWLFSLPSLQTLNLGFNEFAGSLDLVMNSNSSDRVYLNSNWTYGSIPAPKFFLPNLQILALQSNNLSGNVNLAFFSNLENLQILELSSNNFKVTMAFGGDINSWPSLNHLFLSSCNMDGFPSFSRPLENLRVLDLSDNNIHGELPKWLQDMGNQLLYLNLSHNSLTGGFEDLYSWQNLQYLDISSNMLRGKFLSPPLSAHMFMASKNRLGGEITESICELANLHHLDLSFNSLSGEIPQCFGNLSDRLIVLDLRSNELHGTLPTTFRNCSLETLQLNDNRLEGQLPKSLLNCQQLQVLDLGNNKLNDTFPHWLGDLPELQVLVLHSNYFHGPISMATVKHPFPKVRILDLSHSDLSGVLPGRFLNSLKAMMNVTENAGKLQYMLKESSPNDDVGHGKVYYRDSIMFTAKGDDLKLERILTFLTAIDVSDNKFSGVIPESMGKLVSLRWLNASHNNFTGSIPSSLGNLQLLESLDLSSNQLVGQVPQELKNLNFLESFNVSNNQLVGPIPQGEQFNSFGNESYLGNPGLCGPPLSKKCGQEDGQPEPQHPTKDPPAEDVYEWEIVLMGYGCGLIFGLVAGYFMFLARTPLWLHILIHHIREYIMMRASRKQRRSRARRRN
ncbi:hypothetical protein Ancab_023400 [Ancistrocladus abbreviatus]